MDVVFAHGGHWASSLLYTLPVVVMMGFVGFQKLKDRREQRTRHGDSAPPDFS